MCILIGVSQNVNEAFVVSHAAVEASGMPGRETAEINPERDGVVSELAVFRQCPVRANGGFCPLALALPAFAAPPLRRGSLRLSETRLVYRAEARRRRAKAGGPDLPQMEPTD
jgi:hypothetical protein